MENPTATLFRLHPDRYIGNYEHSYPLIDFDVSFESYFDRVWEDDPRRSAYVIECSTSLSSILDGSLPHSKTITDEFPEMKELVAGMGNVTLGHSEVLVFTGLARRNSIDTYSIAVIEAPQSDNSLEDLQRFAEQTYTAFAACKKLGLDTIVTKRFGVNDAISDYIQILSAVLAGVKKISVRYVLSDYLPPVLRNYAALQNSQPLYGVWSDTLHLYSLSIEHIIRDLRVRAKFLYPLDLNTPTMRLQSGDYFRINAGRETVYGFVLHGHDPVVFHILELGEDGYPIMFNSFNDMWGMEIGRLSRTKAGYNYNNKPAEVTRLRWGEK